MCKSKRPHCPLLLTGASGRLGVLLRQVWQNHPGLPRAHFVSEEAIGELEGGIVGGFLFLDGLRGR